jgi:hypothetical protein
MIMLPTHRVSVFHLKRISTGLKKFFNEKRKKSKKMKQLSLSKGLIMVISFLISGILPGGAYAQITITRNDMPDVDDTVRYSTTLTTGGVDYTLTGEDYTWDFSTLTPLVQVVDTFVSVLSTPFIYQLVFLYPFVATIALPQPDIDIIPGYEVTEAYNYYKETDSEYHQAGLAFTITGIPLPLRYDSPDVLYRFPLEYNDVDSSESTFDLDVPDILFFSTYKKRVNTVDGWGTLMTPYGSFETLRVRSMVYQLDSLYVDSIGFGFQIPRNYIEYKWLGNGFGVPLLQVFSEGVITTVTYIDSLRVLVGLPDAKGIPLENIRLYPNPAEEKLFLKWTSAEDGIARYILVSPEGRSTVLKETAITSPGPHFEEFNLSELELSPGMYLVYISLNDSFAIRKLMVR